MGDDDQWRQRPMMVAGGSINGGGRFVDFDHVIRAMQPLEAAD
jgi:hypothetical protein